MNSIYRLRRNSPYCYIIIPNWEAGLSLSYGRRCGFISEPKNWAMPPAAFSNRSSFPSYEYGKGPSDLISPRRFISLWANCEYWKGSIHTSFPGIAVTHFAKRLDVQRGAHHKMTLADDILFFSIITLQNVRTARTPTAMLVSTTELQNKAHCLFLN